MKATKTFYENHKNIIDKTLPEEEKPATDNLITNGGFEDKIEPSSIAPVVHTNELVRPLRLSGFFDTTAQKHFLQQMVPLLFLIMSGSIDVTITHGSGLPILMIHLLPMQVAGHQSHILGTNL